MLIVLQLHCIKVPLEFDVHYLFLFILCLKSVLNSSIDDLHRNIYQTTCPEVDQIDVTMSLFNFSE